MDEQALRNRLSEARAELGKLEDERHAWENAVRSYETLLRLRGGRSDVGTPTLVAKPPQTARPKDAAHPSFRGAMLKVLRDARGEPLHSKEILMRVLALGATTTAKDPQAITDLMGYSLMKTEPIKKVAPRTWRWTGGDAQTKG